MSAPPETAPPESATAGKAATPPYVISHVQLGPVWSARAQTAATCDASLDLGRSQSKIELNDAGITLPDGQFLSWTTLREVEEHTNVCFTVENGALLPIRGLSEDSQRIFQLMPTDGAPAMLVAGFTMHRFRDVDPYEGAARMVRALSPLRGRLLDTATGLGYAALEASKFARQVVTIELDPMAQEMLRANPWSRPLLSKSNVSQLIGNSAELITTFDDECFAAVLHDPPAVNLAGELYAESFYAEVHRVLQRGGRFFHYIGDPNSSSGGRTTRGVIRRMQSAGFARVTPKAGAFGVLAVKGR
jgi:predicted methyltransferase